MKWIPFILIVFGICCGANAQERDADATIREYIEEVVSSIEEASNDNIEFVITLLDELTRKPLDLNRDDLSPLADAGLITNDQLFAFNNHIERHGKFLAEYELQTIPGWDLQDIKRILPLVKVNRDLDDLNLSFKDILRESPISIQTFVSRRFPEARGFIAANDTTPPVYEGDPFRNYIRLRAQYQYRLSAGLTVEKDEGEALFNKSNTAYDYTSFHVYGQAVNKYIRVLALGDYKVNLGQGLILHNGFGGNKSAFVTQIKKGGKIFRPHASTSEINYFRGGGIELNVSKEIKAAAFYSNVKRDANVVIDTSGGDVEITQFTSLQLSGLHRTANEIEDEKQIQYQAIGGRLGYEKRKFNIHVNALQSNFERPLARRIQPYNQFRFNGDQLFNASVDYSVSFGQVHVFGESAMSDNGVAAHLVGAKAGLSKKLNWVGAYRHYPRDYVSIQANAFGEGREANNEVGFYNALEYLISPKFQISAYVDLWSNPWLRFNVDALSRGREYLMKFRYYKKRKLEAYAQYRYEEKAFGSDIENAFTPIEFRRRNQLRCHLNYKVNKSLEWRSRVEYNRVDYDDRNSSGYLIYQDFIYKPIQSSLSFNMRYAFFSTDDSESRIYTYENHLLNNFRLPSFANTGHRYYINVRYRPIKPLTIEFRYDRVLFTETDVISIGSGTQTIDGNSSQQIAVQVRWVFG